MAKKWVDHSLDLATKVENKLATVEKAHVEADKKFKETLAQLTEVEKSYKNAKSTFHSYEK